MSLVICLFLEYVYKSGDDQGVPGLGKPQSGGALPRRECDATASLPEHRQCQTNWSDIHLIYYFTLTTVENISKSKNKNPKH
jgi:hypothetical protein